MLTSKQMTLRPLLESKEGIHLTAYLVNRGDLSDLKSQIRTTIDETYDWLQTVLSLDKIQKFLEPLESLLKDSRVFTQIKGNIGIFRNENSFRILNIPIEIKQSCQVATSFHVKPLLRWLQSDQDFLFLGIEKDSAHLYLGNQNSFKIVDSLFFPEYKTINDTINNEWNEKEIFPWVNDWILELTKNSKPTLFMAGELTLVQSLSRHLRYKNKVKKPISNSFNLNHITEYSQEIRKILKINAKITIEKNLQEFRIAERGNRVQKNIFQISKAVVQGKVRKLIVTDEVNIFGKIDHKSGGITIYPFDLDHEDDCVLDDLAQMVLSKGGEVIIAKRDEIPKGRPILAILEEDGLSLEKTKELQYEAFQERH